MFIPNVKGKVKYFDLSTSDTVNAGDNDVITLQPPQGKRYIVDSILLFIPGVSGATIGSHKFYCYNESMTKTGSYSNFLIKSTYNNNIEINHAGFQGNNGEYPSNLDSQIFLIHGGVLISSYDNPLKFIYENNTDATQSNNRKLYILVIEEEDL